MKPPRRRPRYNAAMLAEVAAAAFPSLTDREMTAVLKAGDRVSYTDGDTVFKAGQEFVDFYVVESGRVEISNPMGDPAHVATHETTHFVGDIDVLTGRPVIVNATARGETTLIRVPRKKLRRLLNNIPTLGEKIIVAFQARRDALERTGKLGLMVVGEAHCRHTNEIREFLHKNFVPFLWRDPCTEAGRAAFAEIGSPKNTPAVRLNDGEVMECPALRSLAERAGVWQGCPTEAFDLAIIGAGPAGMAAAVYAASEGVRTIVLDRVGPGGQAGGSSKIENFIGFPAGLSGTELATRATLQMIKFGVTMAMPVNVADIEPAKSDADPHRIKLDCGAIVRARVILVAVGVTWRKLEAKNADRFDRTGIYYACTTIESDLHQDQDVAVVGGGNSAGQAAMFLSECTGRTVHMLIRSADLAKGMSDYLVGRIKATPNIKLQTHIEIEEVIGTDCVQGLKLHCSASGERTDIPVSGVFVFIGSEPRAAWLPKSITRDEAGYILTGVDALQSGRWPLANRNPYPLETTFPRVLAAGDARHGSTKRVGFAVGDGSLAVMCVHQLMARK